MLLLLIVFRAILTMNINGNIWHLEYYFHLSNFFFNLFEKLVNFATIWILKTIV
jgi:hypothetical protein